MEKIGYIAIDQYDICYKIGDNEPRKWLLSYFRQRDCEKLYRGTKDGKLIQVGYIIIGLQLEVYVIGQWKE